MGVVYKAQDLKLGRLVALKFLPDELARDKHALERFRREARAASALNHPNICTIYDIDEADGRHFIAMELLEGKTLRQRIAGKPQPIDEVLEFGEQIAGALDVAHKKGIIHRDIKPANIFINDDRQVKILDFGLAKLRPLPTAVAASKEEATTADAEEQLTGPGAAVGTVAYMSPEQLLGGDVDEHADIWAAGCVLYWMVAGRGPFSEAPSPHVIADIFHEQPASPSSFNPRAPAALDRIILKCLEKCAGDRYQSARELTVALHDVAHPGSDIPAVPHSRLRLPRWLLIGALLAAMVIVLQLLGVFQYRGRQLAVERGWVLICDFDNTAGNEIPDEALREGLTIDLMQSRYVNVFPRSRAFEVLQRMKRPAAQHIDAPLGREICRRENLNVLIAGTVARIGETFQITVQGIDPARGNALFAEKVRFGRGKEFLVQIDELSGRLRRDLGESLSAIKTSSRPLAQVTTPSLQALQLYSQAADAIAQGRISEAPDFLQSALALDPGFAMAHRMLGSCYSWMVGRTERARAELQLAYDLRGEVTDRERLWIEAEYYMLQGRSEQAEQVLKALVALHPADSDAHYQLAMAYYDLRKLPLAIDEINESLRLNRHSAPAYGKLVVFLARTNQRAEAIRKYEEASRLGLHSPYLHWGLGLAYLGLRQMADARKEFAQFELGSTSDRELSQVYLAITDLDEGRISSAAERLSSPSAAAPGGRAWLMSRQLLGRISLLQDKPAAAIRQATAILARPETDLLALDLLKAGLLCADSGESQQARDVLRRLNAIRSQNPSGWNNRFAEELDGEIAMAEGDSGRAVTAFRRAIAAVPDPVLHRALALAYQRQEQWEPARQEWEQFIAARGAVLQNEFPPDLVVAHLNLARLFVRRGENGTAEEHYRKVLELWSDADQLSLRRAAARELQQLARAKTE